MLLAGALRPTASAAQAGTRSGQANVTLSATRNTRIALTLLSGGSLTLPTIVDGQLNTFAGRARLRTEWTLQPFVTNGIALVAYFGSPTAALANGAAAIPASRVRARLNADAFQSVNGAPVGGVGTAGGSLGLFAVDFGFLNLFNTRGDRTDELEVQLDLRGAAPLPAGTYSGTLTLRAVAL